VRQKPKARQLHAEDGAGGRETAVTPAKKQDHRDPQPQSKKTNKSEPRSNKHEDAQCFDAREGKTPKVRNLDFVTNKEIHFLFSQSWRNPEE
jgi:hypothetical protein